MKLINDEIEEWIKILKKELEEVQEYQETDEEFSRGYFQGMETQTRKTLIKLKGIKNQYKEVNHEDN
jgi:hypothetical protein